MQLKNVLPNMEEEEEIMSSHEAQKNHVSFYVKQENPLLDLKTEDNADNVVNVEHKDNSTDNVITLDLELQESFLQNFKEENVGQKNVLPSIKQEENAPSDMDQQENVLSNMKEIETILSSMEEKEKDTLQKENIPSNMKEEENVLPINDKQDENISHNVLQITVSTDEKEVNDTSNGLEEEQEYMGHFLSIVGPSQEGKCFLCNRFFEKREVPSVVGERGIAGITRACLERNMKPYDITVGQLVHKMCRSRLLQVNVRYSGPPDFSKRRIRKTRMYGRTNKYKRKKWAAATAAVTVKQEIDTDALYFNGNDTTQPPVFVDVKQEPEVMYGCETSENMELSNMKIKQEPLYNQAEDKDKEEQLPPSSYAFNQSSYTFEPSSYAAKTKNIYSYSNVTGNVLNRSDYFINSNAKKRSPGAFSCPPNPPKRNSQEALFRLYSSHIPGPGDNTEGWTLLTDPNTMYKCSKCGFKRKCGDYIKGDTCFCGNKFLCMTLKCALCELYFLNKHSLAKHMDIHTVQEKRLIYSGHEKFECEKCGGRFVTKRELTGHAEFCRHDIKCEFCDQTFNKRSALIPHWTVSHVDHQKRQCLLCGRYLKDRGRIAKHMLLHSGVGKKKYKCDTCGNCFGTSNALESHVCIIETNTDVQMLKTEIDNHVNSHLKQIN